MASATPRARVHTWRAVGEAEVDGSVASVVIRRLPGGRCGPCCGSLLASTGLVRSRSRSSSASAVVRCWVGGPAAVCDVVEVPGRGAQSVRVGGQGAARFGGGLVGGAAGAGSRRARSSRERTTARMRSWTAWFQWPWAACASAAARCSAALRGRSSKSAADEVGRAARGAEAPPQGADDGQRRPATMTTRPSGPPGVAAEAALNSLSTQSQKAFRARWNRLGSFSWYIRLDSSRWAASRAGSRGIVTGGSSPRAAAVRAYGCVRVGVRQRRHRCENSPRQAHRISSPGWCRGRWSRSPGRRRRGPGRGRGPRGGCAGRCRGAR